MNQHNYKRTVWNAPFIAQRADLYVLREGDQWYFTASVPEYDRIALRRADSLEGLRDAAETVVDSGCPIGTYNRANADLLDYARRSGKTILTSLDALSEAKL